MSIWLSKKDLGRTAIAALLDPSPIPTRVVSNGEYLPAPRSRGQREVEQRLAAVADRQGRSLGLDRRSFLKPASGMAAAFLCMNDVYGPLFAVSPVEAADPEAAAERRRHFDDQFVFDVQLHFLGEHYDWEGILELGRYAMKHWNPAMEKDGVSFRRYHFENFLKEVYLDSQTSVGLLSNAPSDDPDKWPLSNDQMIAARETVNAIAGTKRLLSHSVISPGHPGWLDEIDRCVEELRPDSWKGYTVGDPLAPSKFPYRLDDEKLLYPAYAKMIAAGVPIVCIHKGLVPPDYERTFPAWEFAKVDDVGKAARDWPGITFVIYHAALKPLLEPPDQSLAQFERSGRMDWVTDLAEIPEKHGVTNVYAEIGTSFATAAVTHPRHAAAMLGTLIRGLGAERVLWGTDSVWYGSPQWQIEAFRRLEIPEDMRTKHGFAALGAADGPVKTAILGGNAARLYGLEVTPAARAARAGDGLAKIRRDYAAAGGEPNHRAYGFVRTR